MPPSTESLLLDIRQAGLHVQNFVNGKSLEDYLADDMLRAAVERQFEIMGEACNRLKKIDPETLASIREYVGIIAFRNVLIHGYDQIDHAMVWRVIQNKLPFLLDDVRGLMD